MPDSESSKVRAAAHMRVYARTRANIEVLRREIDRYINTSLQKTLVFKTPVFLPITPSHGLFPAFSTPCTPCPFRHGMPARNQRLYCAFAEQTSPTPLTLLRLLSPAHSLTDALPSYVTSSLAPLSHSPPSPHRTSLSVHRTA